MENINPQQHPPRQITGFLALGLGLAMLVFTLVEYLRNGTFNQILFILGVANLVLALARMKVARMRG
ncbi:MAG TPA: hypothetical protein PLO56_12535 [Rhodothermales bacterium]|nr:hypothetical protein [Rhodothermales bacterium]